MKKNILTITLIFVVTSAIAQETIIKPNFLQYSMDSITKQDFNRSLETLFSEMKQGKINEKLLLSKRSELTESALQELVNYEKKKDSAAAQIQDKQLINIYSISADEFYLSISYTYQKPKSHPILLYIINLVATKINDGFAFSVPLDYLTRH